MDNKNFIGSLIQGSKLYFTVMLLFIILTLVFGFLYLALCEVAILVLLFVYDFLGKKKKRKEITNYIEKLSFYLDNASKGTMINFPLPLTVISLTGTIMWYNKSFSKLLGEDALEKQIQNVVPDVQLLKILENKNNISFEARIGDRFFLVVGNMIEPTNENDKDYSIVLYWIDKTNEHALSNSLDASSIVSCLLLVDNYEDLIKNTPEHEQARLAVEIEQLVSQWVSQASGVAVKYEKDKYYILFENEKLQTIIKNKFEILEKAHTINVGNKIPATFSIGIGKGENLIQSDSFAKAAIDMSLGRGGDQAVIKHDGNFEFFGGHSESYEKNTNGDHGGGND